MIEQGAHTTTHLPEPLFNMRDTVNRYFSNLSGGRISDSKNTKFSKFSQTGSKESYLLRLVQLR